MMAEATDRIAGRTIAEILAFHAERNPGRCAIRAPGRDPLTYAELLAAVAGVSQTFREMGFVREDRVALVLSNGPEMAVAFLAVAGSMTCAPLNPSYREDDFAFFFADLGVKAVIVDANSDSPAIAAARRLSLAVMELLPRPGGPAGLFRLGTHGLGSPARARQAEPDDVALVLHTSGTTARPKIVPLTQRNLCVSADNIRRTLALGGADACLNVMPLFHIHGLVGALLSSIAAGASIVCTAGFRGRDFLEWLRESRATWYTAVPTIHQAILEAAVNRSWPVDECGLRFIRSSSASLPPRVMEELAALFAVPVIESYGMTEAAHQMASNPLQAGRQKPGSVGVPAGPDIAVMDEASRILPGGSVGEIVIRGETVTKGYEANPEANAAAFTGGWFRTGDQGYFDDDGYLFLTGRLKELINRGGEKIAPREVEEALLQHSDVAQAVAFAVPHERLGEEVGAAVVLKAGTRVTTRALRQVAQDRLAYFKVPRLIEIVDAIPKGPTGKLQRAGLADKLGLARRRQADHDPPRTPLERALAREWARVLKIDAVGVEDDFFALGGDSLAATELIVRVSELLQTDIPFVDFLDRPTIAGLIRIREPGRAPAATAAAVVMIQSQGSKAPLFCLAAADDSLAGISRLLRHLGKERPVYGIRAPPLDARSPLSTIELLAQRNVAEVLSMRPDGPYYLLGPCFGGAVAFEMARQIERLGRTVGLVVMIDSFNRAWRHTHTAESPIQIRARHLLRRVRFHWETLRAGEHRDRVAYVQKRAGLLLDHWTTEARYHLFSMITRAGLPRPPSLQRPAYASRWAQMRYRPGPYSGRVLLVRSVAPIAGVYPLASMGWSSLIKGDLVTVEVPCEQRELWSDDGLLLQIAGAIRERLDQHEAAQAPAAGERSAGTAR
jgi:oxalate---CoA ligase